MTTDEKGEERYVKRWTHNHEGVGLVSYGTGADDEIATLRASLATANAKIDKLEKVRKG